MPRSPTALLLVLLCLRLPAMELIEDDSPAALTALGNEATQSLQYDRAIGLYKRALATNPTYIYAIFNLGVVHQQRQEPSLARSYYDQVLDLDPDHAQALNNNGIIAFQQQDYRLAIKFFNAAANVADNPPGDN
ncbi:MAG: tetratricopeptide repeat protein, partial [Planctomycetota bacterium]